MGYSRWKLEIGRRYFAFGSRLARRCRFLVCISEKTRQDVLEYVGADEKKLRVIRLGISSTLKPENRKHKRFTIGTLGQLDKRKRIGLLVAAFHKSRLDADLVIAGQGPDLGMLRDMAGRDLRIRFLGLVPEDKLNDFYNSLDLFVFPTGIEGWGLPAVEAMACGKPVVVLNDAILPEEIQGRCISVPSLPWFFANGGVLDAKVDYEENLKFAGEHRWDKCVSEYIKLYEQIKEAN